MKTIRHALWAAAGAVALALAWAAAGPQAAVALVDLGLIVLCLTEDA